MKQFEWRTSFLLCKNHMLFQVTGFLVCYVRNSCVYRWWDFVFAMWKGHMFSGDTIPCLLCAKAMRFQAIPCLLCEKPMRLQATGFLICCVKTSCGCRRRDSLFAMCKTHAFSCKGIPCLRWENICEQKTKTKTLSYKDAL